MVKAWRQGYPLLEGNIILGTLANEIRPEKKIRKMTWLYIDYTCLSEKYKISKWKMLVGKFSKMASNKIMNTDSKNNVFKTM